jgi:hypothetical protein
VIFTSYFDEADTHGPSPTVIMAGYLGHAYQWQRFDKKIRCMQQDHRFTIFHATDFKSRHGEFEGWTDDQCSNLIGDLLHLVKNYLTAGMTIALERERYLTEYRADAPSKMHLDSQYGLCFRSCMGHLIDRMEQRGFRDRLDVVIESGHNNAEDCRRIFHQIKARYEQAGYKFLGSFTTELKSECLPLMVGDMLAATHSMLRGGKTSTKVEDYVLLTPEAPSKKGVLAFLELMPGALRKLKAEFLMERERRAEEWKRRRDARKALSTAA